MEVYCKYSGISFKAELFSHKMKIEAVHPLFYATTNTLLNRSVDWSNNRLSEKERRLLFLSLLYKTELVEFRITAAPSDNTVQRNMEQLLRFIAWKTDCQSSAIRFPKYAINSTTKELENISQWLKSNFDIIEAWKTNYSKEMIRKSLATKEGALERMIKSTLKPHLRLPGALAKWALEASNAPKDLQELWTSLFKLSGIEMYDTKYTSDLDELLEHLEVNLVDSLGTIYATKALSHIRKIHTANRNGFSYGLGIETPEDYKAISDNPFKIIPEDSIETYNREVAIATAPTEMPKKENYPNVVAWIRAKSAFTLALSAKAKELELVKQEAQQQTDAAIVAVLEEEAESEALEEENEASGEFTLVNDDE